MDTERYLRHSPPGRAICKEKECIFTKYRTKLIAIAFILTWLGVSAAFADGMSAVDPHYSGTTVSSHINHGDLVYHLTSPTLPCSHSFVTVFGNSCRTASSTGSYNVVAPVGSALTALSVEFHDRDFFVSADDEYTVWGDNNSTYTLSSSSYPFSGELLSEVYGSVLNSMGISKDLTGVPVGRYPVSLTVTDHGAPPLTGITDAPSSFAFDLWVIDLNERAGSISLVNDGIYEIDLTCAPLDFPHGGECYISASWSGLPTPGQPSVSNLFTDAAYQNPITEDAGSVCVKKWQYGAVGTPKKIYYKRPDSALFSDTIYITLSVGNNVLIQKQLIFTTRSTAMIEHVDGLVSDGHDVSGWWTKNFDLYPATEWQDSNWDGDNNDFIGYDVNDTNRPFVFRTTDRFGLLSAAVRPLENGTLSGYWSVMSDKHGFSDSGMLPNPQDDGNYQLPLGQTNGGFMERINAETVNLEWVISNELIRTKHKVYTIGGTLTNYVNFHTLIDLGCEAAKGLLPSDENAVFNSIWNKFATKKLYRIDDKDDEISANRLKYWGDHTQSSAYSDETIYDLLYHRDGDCLAWCRMFLETLRLQGVVDHTNGVRLQIVDINTNFTVPVEYNGILYTVEGFLQKETVVQGGVINIQDFVNDTILFGGHYLVQYGNDVYDVGTGLKYSPANGLTALQNYVKTALYIQLKNVATGNVLDTLVDSSLIPDIGNAIQ